jgi:hypothetical protein
MRVRARAAQLSMKDQRIAKWVTSGGESFHNKSVSPSSFWPAPDGTGSGNGAVNKTLPEPHASFGNGPYALQKLKDLGGALDVACV